MKNKVLRVDDLMTVRAPSPEHRSLVPLPPPPDERLTRGLSDAAHRLRVVATYQTLLTLIQ